MDRTHATLFTAFLYSLMQSRIKWNKNQLPKYRKAFYNVTENARNCCISSFTVME